MEWSNYRPTKTGFYWLKMYSINGGMTIVNPVIVLVESKDGKETATGVGDYATVELSGIRGQWKGPLTSD